MEQSLIEQLWLHTKQVDDLNQARYKAMPDLSKFLKLNPNQTMQIPSDNYINPSAPLFMSFHNESSNANRHYHDFFEINYVVEGNPIGVFDEEETILIKHSLCIMNPNAIHYFKSYEEDKDLILNIVIPKETFEQHVYIPLLSNKTLNAFFMRYQTEQENNTNYLYLETIDPSVTNLIEMLIKEYLTSTTYSKIIMESLITLLFSYILKGYNEQKQNDDHGLNQVLEYIYTHYTTCTLKEVSEHFNYHPKYLSSLIHKHSGVTFRDLMTKIKLQNSIYFLLYTDHSIEEISALVGYAEKSSFFSSFKKKYGMTPKSYRQSHL